VRFAEQIAAIVSDCIPVMGHGGPLASIGWHEMGGLSRCRARASDRRKRPGPAVSQRLRKVGGCRRSVRIVTRLEGIRCEWPRATPSHLDSRPSIGAGPRLATGQVLVCLRFFGMYPNRNTEFVTALRRARHANRGGQPKHVPKKCKRANSREQRRAFGSGPKKQPRSRDRRQSGARPATRATARPRGSWDARSATHTARGISRGGKGH